MANQTIAREDFRKDDELTTYPVKASTKIYKGALVGVDASGYVTPAAPTSKRVCGVAYETVDNSGGSNGLLNIRVIRKGSFQFNTSGLTIANIGDKVYVTDDNTVQTSSTSTIQVGVVTEFINATTVRVALTANI